MASCLRPTIIASSTALVVQQLFLWALKVSRRNDRQRRRRRQKQRIWRTSVSHELEEAREEYQDLYAMYEEMKQQMTHLEAQLDIQTRKNESLCQVNEALAIELRDCQLSRHPPVPASDSSIALKTPALNADQAHNQEKPLAGALTAPCERNSPQPLHTTASSQAPSVPLSAMNNTRNESLTESKETPARAATPGAAHVSAWEATLEGAEATSWELTTKAAVPAAWEVTPEGAGASAWEVMASTEPEVWEESAQEGVPSDVAADVCLSRDCSSGSLSSLARSDISIGSAVDGPTVSFGSTVNDTPKSRHLQEQRRDSLEKLKLYSQQYLQQNLSRCGSMPAIVGADWVYYEDPMTPVEAQRACSAEKAWEQSFGGADISWVLQEWPELNGKSLSTQGSTTV